jgi:hypothetical protein
MDNVSDYLAFDPWDMHLNPRQPVRNITVNIEPDYGPHHNEPREDAVLVVAYFAKLLQLQTPVQLVISLNLMRMGTSQGNNSTGPEVRASRGEEGRVECCALVSAF